MTQFIFFTKDYPFTCDLHALLADPRDRAALVTQDVHLGLSPETLALFEHVVAVDPFDFEHIALAIERELPLDRDARIVSHDDFFYDVVAALNARFGLPGYRYDEIMPFVTKDLMKERLAHSNVRIPRFRVFERARYRELGDEVGYPIFAKPLRGAGAEHARVIPDQAALDRLAADIGDMPFELDELIEGELYHCDSTLVGGRVVFNQACRYSRPCADFANGFMVGSYPLERGDPLAAELARFADDVIVAMGREHRVPDGVTHMEMFRRADGELVFLEVQFRPPGANVRVSYLQHLGMNLEDAHYALQMGKPIAPIHNDGPYAAWCYFPTSNGVVDSIVPLPALGSSVIEERYYVTSGQTTHAPTSILDARGRGVVALSLVIASPSHATLVEDFDRLRTHVPYTLAEPGVPKNQIQS